MAAIVAYFPCLDMVINRTKQADNTRQHPDVSLERSKTPALAKQLPPS